MKNFRYKKLFDPDISGKMDPPKKIVDPNKEFSPPKIPKPKSLFEKIKFFLKNLKSEIW